jgi:hypothetical protein
MLHLLSQGPDAIQNTIVWTCAFEATGVCDMQTLRKILKFLRSFGTSCESLIQWEDPDYVFPLCSGDRERGARRLSHTDTSSIRALSTEGHARRSV